jgi:hypothetical protein
MSICPRPRKTAKTAFGPPAKKVVNPPPMRSEACGPSQSEVISGEGTGSETVIYVPCPGPVGPAGPTGEKGRDGLGFFWRGEWGTGATYERQDNSSATQRLSDVVSRHGQTYICIQDHVADAMNEPQLPDFVGPTTWTDYWALVAKKGDDGASDVSLSLMDSVWDWIKNADIGDLIAAGLGVAGLIYAGSKIVESMAEDGTGDGQADVRYTGSPGLPGPYAAPQLRDVLSALCDLAGVAHDVSALPDAPCEMVIGNATGARTIIEQLSLAYSFDMVDTGGVLKFAPRGADPVATLTTADLGFSGSAPGASPWSARRFQGIDLPRSVTVKYYAEDLDYNVFTQTAQLFTFPDGQDIQLEVPVTLPHEQARAVAELALVNAHLERQAYSFTTTYAHVDLEPGDVVSAPMGLVRLTKLTEGEEGLIAVEAVDAGGELALEPSGLDVATPPASTNLPLEIGYSQAWFLDPPALDDTDRDVRLYVAVHGFDKPGWPGAAVYASEDGGATYAQVGSTTTAATTGLVAALTPAAPWQVWDETTVVTVELKTGSLLSASAIAVLNGANQALVGQEVIAFRTATLVGPKTYQLSGLLRGRRGTEQYVSLHVANELFVLLDSALVRLPWPDADRSTTKKYKVVTVGSSLDKVDALDVQMFSYNTLSWPVLNGKVLAVGADWQVSFDETVRFDNGLKDLATANHDPDWGGWGIQVLPAVGDTPVAKYTTTSPLWTYSAAMQTTDFGSPQSSLRVRVAQLSTRWGAGYPVTLNS